MSEKVTDEAVYVPFDEDSLVNLQPEPAAEMPTGAILSSLMVPSEKLVTLDDSHLRSGLFGESSSVTVAATAPSKERSVEEQPEEELASAIRDKPFELAAVDLESSGEATEELIGTCIDRMFEAEKTLEAIGAKQLWIRAVVKTYAILLLTRAPSESLGVQLIEKLVDFVCEQFRERIDLALSWLTELWCRQRHRSDLGSTSEHPNHATALLDGQQHNEPEIESEIESEDLNMSWLQSYEANLNLFLERLKSEAAERSLTRFFLDIPQFTDDCLELLNQWCHER